MTDYPLISKDELISDIERDWLALNALLNALSDSQWTDVRNPDGWAVKDHVFHISAWERSIICFLTGKPRQEGLGVTERLYRSKDYDAINARIFEKHRDDPLEQVQIHFKSTHEELMGLIVALHEDDLYKPNSHFLPLEAGGPAQNLIYGNTAAHYREHQQWIEEMLAGM